jgi:Protein of unknown function (DUF4232)
MPGKGFNLALGTVVVLLGWAAEIGGTAAASARSNESSAPECSLSDLSVTAVGGSAASNQEAILLKFQTKGRASCILHGYPKVVALRPGASSTAKERLSIYNGGWTGSEPPVVVLQPGKSASAVVGGASSTRMGQSNACYRPSYRTVRISIPGSRGSVTISARLPKEGALCLPSCQGVTVTPFAPSVGWFLHAQR